MMARCMVRWSAPRSPWRWARARSAARTADRRPLEVLEELLGQRLLAELRFRRGLTYPPWAYNVFHRDSDYFGAQVTVADRHEDWTRDTLLGGD